MVAKLHPQITQGARKKEDEFQFNKDAGLYVCKAGHMAVRKARLSGKQIPLAANKKVTIPAKSAVVLKLTSDVHKDPKPFRVDFVQALAGNGYAGITWKTTAGAESYTIKRSDSENGTYNVIATGVEGNYYKDSTSQNGKVYYYKVAAVNQIGAGDDSYRAKLVMNAPVSGLADTVWRDDRIGEYFLDMAPEESVIDSSSLTKFRKLRLKNLNLLDMLINKTVEIAMEKGIIQSRAIIVDATHTKARYNQKSPREILQDRSLKLRKAVFKVDESLKAKPILP